MSPSKKKLQNKINKNIMELHLHILKNKIFNTYKMK